MQWTVTDAPNTATINTATLLSNGQVFVAGGNNMVSITASSEVDY
jgi:hypothetical protein